MDNPVVLAIELICMIVAVFVVLAGGTMMMVRSEDASPKPAQGRKPRPQG